MTKSNTLEQSLKHASHVCRVINVMLTGEHPSRKLAEGHLGRVVRRCTQVSPEKRYPNVLRLMEAL